MSSSPMADRGAAAMFDVIGRTRPTRSKTSAFCRSQHRQIRRIMRHLLRLSFRRGWGWVEPIDDARAEIEDLPGIGPGLRSELDAAIASAIPRAIKLATRDSRVTGNWIGKDGHHRRTMDTADQTIGGWFPPEPPRE